MKRIRRLVAPATAVVALVGFFLLPGLGGTAFGGTANIARATPSLGLDPVAQAQRQQLTTGCNQVAETGLPAGGKVSDWINQNVQPANAVISVWHYDNASQHYKAAYFQDPAVPVDVPTFSGTVDAFFICVDATATAP